MSNRNLHRDHFGTKNKYVGQIPDSGQKENSEFSLKKQTKSRGDFEKIKNFYADDRQLFLLIHTTLYRTFELVALLRRNTAASASILHTPFPDDIYPAPDN